MTLPTWFVENKLYEICPGDFTTRFGFIILFGILSLTSTISAMHSVTPKPNFAAHLICVKYLSQI